MKRRRLSSLKTKLPTSGRQHQPSDRLDQLIHDMRNCFNAIRLAQYFLDDKPGLSPQELEAYQAVLRSNLSQATELMEQLLQAASLTSKQAKATTPSRTALLKHLTSQLPQEVTFESADELAYLKKLIEIGLQGS